MSDATTLIFATAFLIIGWVIGNFMRNVERTLKNIERKLEGK